MHYQLMGPTGFELATTGFLKSAPAPTTQQVTSFLLLFPVVQRNLVAQTLVAQGVNVATVADAAAAALLQHQAVAEKNWEAIKKGLTLASASVSAYHGYRRNDSIFWAAWWFAMGLVFPIFTPIIAAGQIVAGKRSSS